MAGLLGEDEPAVCHDLVLRQAGTGAQQRSIGELGIVVSLTGRLAVPNHRPVGIPLDAAAIGEGLRQEILGIGVSAHGGFTEVGGGNFVVLLHPFAKGIADADQIERAQTQYSPPDDLEDADDSVPARDAMDDEDLSLMLIEREETKPELTAATSFTEPQIPQARDLELEDIAPGTEELSLEDNTQNKIPEEQSDTQAPTLTSPTATALHADETRANPNSPTVTRADSTSTRTYAPATTARTLMKVANEDASNIFSGMKSDSDVVMTPDYAKKVFRSKTSVQRARHYWAYTGIMVVLALSIILFGVFEYQDQSELIDSSLRSLKRDPMPGVIKTAQPEKIDLFIESDPKVNARTVEIIESSNQAGSIPVVEDTVSQAEIDDTVSQAEIENMVSQAEIKDTV